MGVRETLNKIENMVATAKTFPFTGHILINDNDLVHYVLDSKTFPFTGHILINDNDLVHYVEELRNDLPKELDKAEVIMKERDQIIEDARREAEHIRTEAERQAAAMVENSEIVLKSKQRGKEILQETQQKETAMVQAAEAQARDLQNNVDAYANQVFEQLIAHVSRTFDGVQQAQNGRLPREHQLQPPLSCNSRYLAHTHRKMPGKKRVRGGCMQMTQGQRS